MRGPMDDAIQAVKEEPAAEPEPAELERPPGGKPLLRLLDLLAPKGIDAALAAAMDTALGANGDRADAEKRLTEMGVHVAPPPVPTKSGSRRRKAPKAPEATAPPEDIAVALAEAAQQLGQPTATGP